MYVVIEEKIVLFQSAVSVLGLIQEILPHVAALNNLSLVTQQTAIPETMEDCHTTTSHHYAWVESDHPYRPAAVANFRFVACSHGVLFHPHSVIAYIGCLACN